ncbi:hypothetical protein [Oharaeibacter diazotrophicus]|uniref:Uncharacterized protein n=1 Tax=Oharaeibacter diazotrophicus TaxID=1920512 RepID=A0A4R6RFL4_9HYPH|nr:hypothetical protein [Oharaeibacter diazotrophicus]TDP85129.1 hypothetical protein EDD54_1976 [Oharaeibacter diazotrophicus]BBE74099.1 hypothetical protein OHA_1_03726 [Pleomorphomonas sp. SM30]GLS76213.1 hypothetical protein GCM10007904_15480 [Oharaeibacter diazotrophicus]
MVARGSASVVLAAVVLAEACVAASAALPPWYQRAREFEAVVSAVADISAPDVIEKVEYVEIDLYRVTYGHCAVAAWIRDVPAPEGQSAMVGPRQFKVELGTPKC